MKCTQCWDSGRVHDWQVSRPCSRCEPESAAAGGTPTCRACGGVLITIPGQRANLGWLCTRCDPSYLREHRRLMQRAVSSERIDWTKPVEGWRLFDGGGAR